MPHPTVIIPTLLWNPEYLEETLRALLDGSYRDFEALVVVNGLPSQESSRIETKLEDARLKWLFLGANQGFTGAVQAGIDHVFADEKFERNKLIALLNDDAIPDREWLTELLKKQKTTQADMIASKIFKMDKETIDSLGFTLFWRGQAWALTGQEHQHQAMQTRPDYWLNNLDLLTANKFLEGNEQGELDPSFWQEPFGPDAAACLYTAKLFEKVGGFNQRFFAYLEDVELALRARQSGMKCALAEKAVVYHHKHATAKNGVFKAWQDWKNWWRLVLQCFSVRVWLKFGRQILVERLRNTSGLVKSFLQK